MIPPPIPFILAIVRKEPRTRPPPGHRVVGRRGRERTSGACSADCHQWRQIELAGDRWSSPPVTGQVTPERVFRSSCAARDSRPFNACAQPICARGCRSRGTERIRLEWFKIAFIARGRLVGLMDGEVEGRVQLGFLRLAWVEWLVNHTRILLVNNISNMSENTYNSHSYYGRVCDYSFLRHHRWIVYYTPRK